MGNATSNEPKGKRVKAGQGYPSASPQSSPPLAATSTESKTVDKTLETAGTRDIASDNESKAPAESVIEMLEAVRPQHCIDGKLAPGQMLKWMDICACLSAEAHAGKPSVTATVDDLQFVRPIQCGQLLILKAQVNRAFNTSMEVGVRVETEDLMSGAREPCCSAYFVFVTLEKQKLPGTLPLTPDEVRRHALAQERKKIRLSRKKTLDDFFLLQTSQSETDDEAYSVDGSPPASSRESAAPSLPSKDIAVDPLDVTKSQVVPTEEVTPQPLVLDASASVTKLTELVLPPHANHMGNTFGGQIMEWAATAASISACRHARRPVVVASIDDIYFVSPSTVGDRVHVVSQVNRAFQTSFEVGVKAEAQGPEGGSTRVICRAYFTLVALPQGKQKATVPQVRPGSREEIRRYHKALGRRKIRLERRAIGDDFSLSSSLLAWTWIPELADEYKVKNIDALLSVATEPVQWEKLHEVYGVTISMRERHSVQCFQLTTRVKAVPSRAAEFVRDFATRSQWDQLFSDGKVVVQLDANNDISWLAIKDRDFALLRSWREDSVVPGRHILASRSIVHPKVPEKEGFVRAEVASSGFIISPVFREREDGTTAADHTQCDITYVAQMGAKAVSLTMEDMFEKRKPLLDSFLALRQCLENLPKQPVCEVEGGCFKTVQGIGQIRGMYILGHL